MNTKAATKVTMETKATRSERDLRLEECLWGKAGWQIRQGVRRCHLFRWAISRLDSAISWTIPRSSATCTTSSPE
jgi:hypothetical protein